MDPIAQIPEVALQVLFIFLNRDTIHSRASASTLAPKGTLKRFHVDMM
jgi:hypothetical protein